MNVMLTTGTMLLQMCRVASSMEQHTDRRQAVDLIEEDDGGLGLLRLLKQQPELALSLAHPLGQNISALAHEEGDLGACLAGGCS